MFLCGGGGGADTVRGLKCYEAEQRFRNHREISYRDTPKSDLSLL